MFSLFPVSDYSKYISSSSSQNYSYTITTTQPVKKTKMLNTNTFYCIHEFDNGKQLYKIEYAGDLVEDCAEAWENGTIEEFLNDNFDIPFDSDEEECETFEVLTEDDFFYIPLENSNEG